MRCMIIATSKPFLGMRNVTIYSISFVISVHMHHLAYLATYSFVL